MAKYDKIFKKNLQRGFLKIVSEFLNMPFDDVIISEKPTELTAKTLRTDFVFQVKRDGKNEIWHIEEQTDDDVNMLERMLKYIAFLYEKYKLPIYQIVLYVGNKPTDKSGMVCKQHIGKTAERFLSVEEEVFNFAGDLIVLSEKRKLDKQVSVLISKIMSSLTDYRRTYPFQQGVLEGEQIGLQKGKREGKEEGEKVAQQKAIKNMLLKGNFRYEQIADILEVNVVWVREIAELLRK